VTCINKVLKLKMAPLELARAKPQLAVSLAIIIDDTAKDKLRVR
jgi:hypothetical protein